LVTLICSYVRYYISLSMSLVPFFLKLNVVSLFGRGNVIHGFLEWFRG